MTTAVHNLQEWFDKLSTADKVEVINFLYEGVIVHKGSYYGPHPQVLFKGLNIGPKPTAIQSPQVCPTCKRPL